MTNVTKIDAIKLTETNRWFTVTSGFRNGLPFLDVSVGLELPERIFSINEDVYTSADFRDYLDDATLALLNGIKHRFSVARANGITKPRLDATTVSILLVKLGFQGPEIRSKLREIWPNEDGK